MTKKRELMESTAVLPTGVKLDDLHPATRQMVEMFEAAHNEIEAAELSGIIQERLNACDTDVALVVISNLVDMWAQRTFSVSCAGTWPAAQIGPAVGKFFELGLYHPEYDERESVQ